MVGDSSGKLARQMAELVGGGSAGKMAPDCLAVWDASLRACMCACPLGGLDAWPLATVLTDSMPNMCRLSTPLPMPSEEGRQRQRRTYESKGLWVVEWVIGSLAVWRGWLLSVCLSVCLSGWLALRTFAWLFVLPPPSSAE